MVYNFNVNWIGPLDKASPCITSLYTAKQKFSLFFNFLDAMQLMCLTMQLIFTIKSMKTLGVGVLTSEQRILIIDIIDGYKGGGYGASTQHELGG